ncbi:flavin reductase family protein [Chryseolinea sp. T2]|uniref:flavin reductase family protein n=1 Tax=Chryseolinea sp. T2 TaxID=3129255 RepID=UPI003078764C
MHQVSNPSILYFGTPVVLVGTRNGDDTFNVAPISSVFWLGYRCIIGISAVSKTTENILRTKECVLNLPSVEEAKFVNRLALTTGSNPVPPGKLLKGYAHVSDKFAHSGLTPAEADLVSAPRVKECPVQMEASFVGMHPIGAENGFQEVRVVAIELKILRVHLEQSITMTNNPNRVDPDKWKPLIMSFQEFYGLGEKVHSSALAQVPEMLYRTRDTEVTTTTHERVVRSA